MALNGTLRAFCSITIQGAPPLASQNGGDQVKLHRWLTDEDIFRYFPCQ